MKGKLINGKFAFKGINIFGLIITTKRALENVDISADELIINKEQKSSKDDTQLNRGGVNKHGNN